MPGSKEKFNENLVGQRNTQLPVFQGHKKELNASHPKSIGVGLTGVVSVCCLDTGICICVCCMACSQVLSQTKQKNRKQFLSIFHKYSP